jgi:hypothetical protein
VEPDAGCSTGDALAALRSMPDARVDAVITGSPVLVGRVGCVE